MGCMSQNELGIRYALKSCSWHSEITFYPKTWRIAYPGVNAMGLWAHNVKWGTPGGPDVISGYLVTSVCRQKWQPRSRVCGDLYLFLTQFLQNRASVTAEDLRLCNRNVCTVQASSLPGLFQLCWHDTKEGAIRAQRTDSSLLGAGAESRGWERESALYLAA